MKLKRKLWPSQRLQEVKLKPVSKPKPVEPSASEEIRNSITFFKRQKKWELIAKQKRSEIKKKLEPTYIGKLMVRSTYQLPDLNFIKPKPGRPLSEILNRFYDLNQGSNPLKEKLYRYKASVAASFRVYRYAGGYYISVTKAEEGDRHLAMMYSMSQDKTNHAIASIKLEVNFFNSIDLRNALYRAINLKSFKCSSLNCNTHIPY